MKEKQLEENLTVDIDSDLAEIIAEAIEQITNAKINEYLGDISVIENDIVFH